MLLSISAPAAADPGNQPTGNSSQAMWMDLARGYGWVKSRLSLQPKGSKDGKVRTGLSSFRNSVRQPTRTPPVKLKRPTFVPKKKSAPASKPLGKKSRGGAYKSVDLANIKPPPGVRAIRRLPTRVRSR